MSDILESTSHRATSNEDAESMSDGEAARLLELLALYARLYGQDCPASLTVIDLADDLATTLAGQYAPASRPEEWRDDVQNNLG